MTQNNNHPHSPKKRLNWGLLLSLALGIIASCIFSHVIYQHLFPEQDVEQPEHNQLNGPDALLLSLNAVEGQMKNFAVTTEYAQIQGEEFHFDPETLVASEDIYYDPEIIPYFNTSGKISQKAYFDTTLGILYLDYGIEYSDCFTYLSLDSTQTGTGTAQPLSGIITAGSGIHSLPYPYEKAPEYISVVGLVSKNSACYYFMELHRQQLDVFSGSTQELAQIGIGIAAGTPTAEPVTLDGIWFAIAQPTVADDEDHSFFADAGYYTMSADGSFTYTPVTLGKKGTWYHIDGGNSFYEGTYQYDGITMNFHFTGYQETYFDEALGYETVRSHEIDKTEQFAMQINQSCTEMCAVIPEHPTLGQIYAFEKCKSDDPIRAMLIKINGQF